MAEKYIDPEDIVTDFLRVHLTDPKSRAESTDTQNDTSTAGQTTLTITPSSGSDSVSCITSLTVDGSDYAKWQDYFWDYQNSEITFFSALSAGQAIATTYKYGSTNWIYSDMPDENLNSDSWPRVDVFTVSSPGRRLGNYEAPVYGRAILQIDIWSKNNYIATIGSKKYSGPYLTRYIGNRISRAFEDNENDLYPLLFNYEPISLPRTAPYSGKYQAYHTIVEVSLQGLSLGRIVY